MCACSGITKALSARESLAPVKASLALLSFLTARARSRKILMGSLKIPTCCCCNTLTGSCQDSRAYASGLCRRHLQDRSAAPPLRKILMGSLKIPTCCCCNTLTGSCQDSRAYASGLCRRHLQDRSAAPPLRKILMGSLKNPNVLLLQHFDWFLSRFARIRFWSLPQASAGPQRSTTIAKDSHGILENPNVLLLQHFDWFLSRFARIRFWSLPQASAAPQTAAQRQHHHAATRPTFIVYSLFIVGVPGPGWSIGVYRFQFWYCRNECGQ